MKDAFEPFAANAGGHEQGALISDRGASNATSLKAPVFVRRTNYVALQHKLVFNSLRKRGHMINFWYGITFGPSELTWLSQVVVALRLNKFALEGFGAFSEARQMVSEKVTAFSDAVMNLAMGTFPHVVMDDLRSIVDENVKRLSA